MAVLDLRLLDLFEALIKARFDWLVIELVDGIGAGRPTEETEGSLAEARARIGEGQPTAHGEPRAMLVETKPITGDEQIVWAADYVGERLGAALTQLDAAMEVLDLIADGPNAANIKLKSHDLPAVMVLLVDDEGERKVDRAALTRAQASIPKLLEGLASWSQQMQGGVQI